MIAEALIAGVSLFASVSVVASLRFAKWLIEWRQARRDDRDPIAAKRRALAEQRRITERDRAEWLHVKDNIEPIRKLDARLLAIADEEAALLASDD